jgi:predicted GIY-YIG superfamily endonuclease
MGKVNTDSKLWEAAYKTHKVRPIKYDDPNTKHQITKPKEPMALQHELVDVKRQIKRLLQRKKHLERVLKNNGQKQIRSEYFDVPISLYALKLEDGCYYVGQSRNPANRFKKHLKGKGAKWTKLHPPIEIIELRSLDIVDDVAAALKEDDMTIEYAMKYGSEVVRGGGYCQSKPRWPQEILQNERIIL